MKTKILCLAISVSSAMLACAKGDLQIHFIDVGQGDSELIVSPQGETVLVDAAEHNQADRVVAYLDQLGLTNLDYFIASHFDSDHIGGVEPVLSHFRVAKASLDRGSESHTRWFTNYVETVGTKRQTAFEGSALVLDADSTQPVTLSFVARNGHEVEKANDENDKSLVFVLHYGQFDAEFGGDLSGKKTSQYRDVETSVAPDVGQVEVYKVHHHGSKNSSNSNWLSTIKPKVAILSCGDTNTHHHPDREALDRLHNAGATVYWTEAGNGVKPVDGLDKVGGSILVKVPAHSTTFTVTYGGNQTDTNEVWNPQQSQSYAWSSKSSIYHYSNCVFVHSIRPENLVTGAEPPDGKKLHVGCPLR